MKIEGSPEALPTPQPHPNPPNAKHCKHIEETVTLGSGSHDPEQRCDFCLLQLRFDLCLCSPAAEGQPPFSHSDVQLVAPNTTRVFCDQEFQLRGGSPTIRQVKKMCLGRGRKPFRSVIDAISDLATEDFLEEEHRDKPLESKTKDL